MHKRWRACKTSLRNTSVEGTAAGGVVTCAVNGEFRVTKLTIQTEASIPKISTRSKTSSSSRSRRDRQSEGAQRTEDGQAYRRHEDSRTHVVPNGVAGPVAALINEFSKLPTIGPKTAARLVFHLLNQAAGGCGSLADAIIALKDRVRLCFALLFDYRGRSVYDLR